MICFPHAKINLGLHVLGKRADGYHNLETCFFPVLGLTDVLEMVEAEAFQFSTSGLEVDVQQDNNLVVRAFRQLQQHFSLPNVHIHLHKVIPMGAGLGGGSSDATFVIRLCNQLFKLNLPVIEIRKLAAQLGSDCAFFAGDEPMLASGKGEILEALYQELPPLELLIISPGVHVSTADAYAGLTDFREGIEWEQALQQPVTEWKNLLFNSFESTVFGKYPVIGEAKNWLYSHGAQFALMSGSGATVFGIFEAGKELPPLPDHLTKVYCSERIHLNR